jgi:hypothetical protein
MVQLGRRVRIAVEAAAAVLVGTLVVFLWVSIGMWSVEPVRYPDAARWWRNFLLPPAAEALLVSVPAAAAAAFTIGQLLRTRG